MTIEARIIADSINPAGNRLTTFQLRYPRSSHAHILTHRAFSRSASSSRAIPITKEIASVMNEPAIPPVWGKNGRGMSPKGEVDNTDKVLDVYERMRDFVVGCVQELNDLGVHKQHANRYLEPYNHINVVLTATDFGNFFTLRLAQDTQTETRMIAESMLDAYLSSEPVVLTSEQWHLPYVTEAESHLSLAEKRKVSAARCARVSYNVFNFDRPSLPEEDIRLCDNLIADQHMSPFEHVAMALAANVRIANFAGWLQYRVLLDSHSIQ